MDDSLTGGFPMAVMGVGTVFVALVALVGTVAGTSRLLAGRSAARAAPVAGGAEQTPGDAQEAAAGDDLLYAALAAYTFHRQRHANAPRPESPSQWAHAGRARQFARFQR